MNQITTERLILYPLAYEELGVLITEKPRVLGDISLADLLEGDIPQRPIEIKRGKMERLPYQEHIWCTYFLMVNKETMRAVGLLGFKGVPVDEEVEVGYGTAEAYRAQGYMSEALAGLLNWAAGTARCKKVIANTHVGNSASQKVLLKCGFTRVGETGEMLHFERELG